MSKPNCLSAVKGLVEDVTNTVGAEKAVNFSDSSILISTTWERGKVHCKNILSFTSLSDATGDFVGDLEPEWRLRFAVIRPIVPD